MNLLTSKEIRGLNNEQIREEILNLKRVLFDFRLKQATRQSIKPHILKMHKRQVARIMTIEHQRQIQSKPKSIKV
jgi:large subunit ribosomal protein L29